MSDAQAFDFSQFVPGFDFLKNVSKGASQGVPQMPKWGSWVAPTLNVEELDKRIDELKAVQFWLDQNAAALKATIQALEVQKMTLATLKGMNFSMGDLANAFKLKAFDAAAGGADNASEGASQAASTAKTQEAATTKPAGHAKKPAAGVVDPMQWWGALTEQFQTIAASAMKEAAKQAATHAARKVTTGMSKPGGKASAKPTGGLKKPVARKAVTKAPARPAQKKTRSRGLAAD